MGGTGKVFLSLHKGFYLVNQEFQGTFLFEAVVKEGEDILNSYDDEFPLEHFEVKIQDFFSQYPFLVDLKNFNELWDNLGDAKV